MIVKGCVKLRELGLKKDSFKSVTPPRVKFSLQSDFAVGDFHHGNRPFDVCSFFMVDFKKFIDKARNYADEDYFP